MEEINHASRMLERRTPKPQEQVNCPRCNSTNTKFCYYNNYSLTQPRYFCKTCRRYWTEGGSLRNVPVGGGSRKNKRMSSSSTSSSKLGLPDLNPPNNINQFTTEKIQIKGQDLNLSFPDQTAQIENNMNPPMPALELLRSGIASRGLNSFIPTPMQPTVAVDGGGAGNTMYSPGAVGFGSMHEFKPNQLSLFSIDGLGNNNRYGHHHNLHLANQDHDQNNNNGNGRFNFFPFGELKQIDENNKGSSQENNNNNNNNSNNNPGGYWTGMLGGGGSW